MRLLGGYLGVTWVYLGVTWGLLGGLLGGYLGLLAFTWGLLETAFTQTTRLNTKSSHITPNETHA